jgi:DNA-binding MarR family transcriptional regulator
MYDEQELSSRELVGRWVGRVYRRRFQLSELLLERMGIGPGQVPILTELNHHGSLTQRELAEHTHVTAATISGTLKRMERAGLIYRTDDTHDARVSIVRLTDEGKNVVHEAGKYFRKTDFEMLQGFSDAECDMLLDCFMRMRENLVDAIKCVNSGEEENN